MDPLLPLCIIYCPFNHIKWELTKGLRRDIGHITVVQELIVTTP